MWTGPHTNQLSSVGAVTRRGTHCITFSIDRVSIRLSRRTIGHTAPIGIIPIQLLACLCRGNRTVVNAYHLVIVRESVIRA